MSIGGSSELELTDSAGESTGPPDGRPTAIEVDEIHKSFHEVEAVRGISFRVAVGETFGFLGPNGAGKSTTISILCTLIRPTSGRAAVAGFDVVKQAREVRRPHRPRVPGHHPRRLPYR